VQFEVVRRDTVESEGDAQEESDERGAKRQHCAKIRGRVLRLYTRREEEGVVVRLG